MKFKQMVFSSFFLLHLSGCVINQTNSEPYPDEELQHLVGSSRDEILARLGPPDRTVEGDYGLINTWLANYRGASSIVHNMNCQFHFVFNAEMKVTKIDMTGDTYVCRDFIRLNKKQFGVN